LILFSIYFYSDYTIVSGDSLGNTQFWDGRTCTLLKTYTPHRADVLSVAVTEKTGNPMAFSAGIDNKICLFQLVENRTPPPGETSTDPSMNFHREWIYNSSLRHHTRDINSLAIHIGPKRQVLVSGGVDTRVLLYDVTKDFLTQNPRKLEPFPPASSSSGSSAAGAIVKLAVEPRLMLAQHPAALHLWRLGTGTSDP
jgi:U3 small nucleolar RNA-associated protein 4